MMNDVNNTSKGGDYEIIFHFHILANVARSYQKYVTQQYPIHGNRIKKEYSFHIYESTTMSQMDNWFQMENHDACSPKELCFKRIELDVYILSPPKNYLPCFSHK